MLQAGNSRMSDSFAYVKGCLADASIWAEDPTARGLSVIEHDGNAYQIIQTGERYLCGRGENQIGLLYQTEDSTRCAPPALWEKRHNTHEEGEGEKKP